MGPSSAPGAFGKRSAEPGPIPARDCPAYAFGDDGVAAERLGVLQGVFGSASAAFVTEWRPARVELALDLGCGPGFTTRMVAELCRGARVIGLDASDAFLALADDDIEVMRHDVTVMPFPVPRADLVYARYLLAHLDEPNACVRAWSTQMRAGGRLLLEEVEAIEAGPAVFGRYLATVAAMMCDEGHELYVGPSLDTVAVAPGSRRVFSGLTEVRPTTGEAARMFLPNLGVWRSRPAVRAHADEATLDRLAAELQALTNSESRGEIVWHMRQTVFERTH